MLPQDADLCSTFPEIHSLLKKGGVAVIELAVRSCGLPIILAPFFYQLDDFGMGFHFFVGEHQRTLTESQFRVAIAAQHRFMALTHKIPLLVVQPLQAAEIDQPQLSVAAMDDIPGMEVGIQEALGKVKPRSGAKQPSPE